MFDIGFWELALIGIVALLVVGPDRLPALARAAGIWLGRIRHFMASVKTDFEREMHAQEIKETLNKKTTDFKDAYDIVEESGKDISDIGIDLNKVDDELARATSNAGTEENLKKPSRSDDDQ